MNSRIYGESEGEWGRWNVATLGYFLPWTFHMSGQVLYIHLLFIPSISSIDQTMGRREIAPSRLVVSLGWVLRRKVCPHSCGAVLLGLWLASAAPASLFSRGGRPPREVLTSVTVPGSRLPALISVPLMAATQFDALGGPQSNPLTAPPPKTILHLFTYFFVNRAG